MNKSSKRIIAERIHHGIFSLLYGTVSNDVAYNMASGYCPIFESEYNDI